MKSDILSRQRKLMEDMAEDSIGSLIVSGRKDIYYHTGFMPLEGDFAFLVFKKRLERPVLFVSSLSNHAKMIDTADVEFARKISEVADFLKKGDRDEDIGYDEKDMHVSVFNELSEYIKRSHLKPKNDMIKNIRRIKSENEIRELQKAAKTTERILSGVRNYMEGKKESDVSDEIDINMIRSHSRNSFSNIVASGRNSAYVHYMPGRRIIKDKDMVVVDIGATSKHYAGDMTRTFSLAPGKREKALHENIRDIQDTLIDIMVDGADVAMITEKYREEMEKKGYPVMHGWGHGVGLDVHEPLGSELKKGMVVTVEPGAYVMDFAGCRIEDMLLIKQGKAKKLTSSSNEL